MLIPTASTLPSPTELPPAHRGGPSKPLSPPVTNGMQKALLQSNKMNCAKNYKSCHSNKAEHFVGVLFDKQVVKGDIRAPVDGIWVSSDGALPAFQAHPSLSFQTRPPSASGIEDPLLSP